MHNAIIQCSITSKGYELSGPAYLRLFYEKFLRGREITRNLQYIYIKSDTLMEIHKKIVTESY